jgi:hypothetical protein
MAALVSATARMQGDGIGSWDPQAAAAYLDERQGWWFEYPSAARDGTACVSCHTALPYALARPALRPRLNERRSSATETKLIGDVVKRVRAWKDVAPYYPDQTRGLPKTAESRGTEAILNAVILARRDSSDGTLSNDLRLSKQEADGGWSMSSLGPWQRTDGSAQDTHSDGYATGLAALALQQAGVPPTEPRVRKGLQWLVDHQDKATGRWSATSLNKQRDPASDAGRFMSDAATAYAVLALTSVQH